MQEFSDTYVAELTLLFKAPQKCWGKSPRPSMPTDQMMSKLGKHWDIPAQCKFNDVIRRSGDLIFFPKSNILCDLQSHIPQIYIYVLMIHTEDKSFLDYARWSKKVDFF